MLLVGVDPGSRFCGFALLQVEKNRIIAAGCEALALDAKLDFPYRLLELKRILTDRLERYRPEEAAVEEIFYGKNIQTAITLGQVRGVILLALAECGVKIHHFSPREIKKAVTGNGNASKKQVRYMVQKLVPLTTMPSQDDATDALASAICLFHRMRGF